MRMIATKATITSTLTVVALAATNCKSNPDYALTVDNWNQVNGDKSLSAFWDGGTDGEGVKWKGSSSYGDPHQFTTQLGIELQNKNTWNCSGLPFENHCSPERCSSIGKYNSHGELTSDPSRWGLLALNSVSNLHKWISMLYNGIQIGQGDASSYAFKIATDFAKPKDKPSVVLKDLFSAASLALGILGVLPATRFTPLIGAGNTVQGFISTELGNHLASDEMDNSFQLASAYDLAITNFADVARQSLESANGQILNSADDTTLNLLKGGGWIQAPAATETDIGNFFRRNMIARGINAVWRTYSSYVYYIWLNDQGATSTQTGTKCDLDRSGPQHAKYCADEGVYYLYMFDDGNVNWPYGGPSLQPDPYKINPVWAVESSARSFKAQGINYDPSKTDVSQLLGTSSLKDFLSQPERLEGTWTLPVCDGSSFGQFNFDYENGKRDGGTHPCVCGIDGRDTAAFMEAAKINSKNAARRCFNWWVVEGTDNWPTGSDSIAYSSDGKNTVTKGGVIDCRKHSGASNPKYCEVS